MASTINASTSGAGGVITTADASGVLNIQTAGVTAISADASQNVTLTNALPIASGGTGVTTGPFSMTLLGTITPTAANSISLSGLTLTSYKSLYVVINNITQAGSGNINYVSSTNVQSGGGFYPNSAGPNSGIFWLDLGTGAIGGNVYANTVTGGVAGNTGGLTNVTTSSTIIYFRLNASNSYSTGGSIVIYGVK